jgi:hypothetical protein
VFGVACHAPPDCNQLMLLSSGATSDRKRT